MGSRTACSRPTPRLRPRLVVIEVKAKAKASIFNQPTTNDVTTQPISISASLFNALRTDCRACSQSTCSAVRPECSSSSRHAEAQIRPHHCDIARRLTLAAYSAAGNVQTMHHRLQMPTRSSSTIPVRTVYTSLHQRWTSFPAFSNIW